MKRSHKDGLNGYQRYHEHVGNHAKMPIYIYICELHFQEKDFIQNSVDTNNRCKRKKAADDTWVGDVLRRKRLTKGAFPSIWPGAPCYLSKISPVYSSPKHYTLSIKR